MPLSEIGLVVFGEEGEGKSTLCNTLTGSNGEAFEERDFITETKETIGKEGKFDNQATFLIDTPGLCDSQNNNDAHLVQMVQYIKDNNLIKGFIFTINVHRPKFNDNQRRLFELISNIYPGAPWFKHIAIVWTRCFSQMAEQIEEWKEERKKGFKYFFKQWFGPEISEEEINSIPHFFVDSVEARKNNNSSHNELNNLLVWAGQLKLIKDDLPNMKVKLGEPKVERRTKTEIGKTWTDIWRVKRCYHGCYNFGPKKSHGRTYQTQTIITEERTCQEFTDGSIEQSDWKEINRITNQVIINSW